MNRFLKRATLFCFLFSLFSTLSFTQEFELYNWDEERQFVQGVDEKEGLIMIKNHVQYDYVFEEGNLVCYKTYHKIYRANNDEAVERVNRIYIPMNGTLELVSTQARTMTSSGRVTVLNKDNIKQVKDEDVGSGYTIFAIEGAEVGADIEYLYTSKVNASLFGREYFQFEFPVMNTTFKVSTPSNLKFEFKSYNGLPGVDTEETEEANLYSFSEESIPTLREELFGYYTSNRKRVEFKLSYNTASGKQRLFTWSDAGKRVHEILYPFSNGELKAANSLIKELNLKKNDDPYDKLANLEHYVKTNYYIDDQAGDNAENVEMIVANHFSSELGFVRLFLALTQVLEIETEIVMTSPRDGVPFDGSFESWNYLQDYLIYLPGPGKFLTPDNFAERIGSAPYQYAPGEGLFIKQITFEGVNSVLSQIKKIPEESYEANFDNLLIHVTFSDDLTENYVEVERSFKGISADYLKIAELKASEEQKEEVFKDILQYLSPEAEIGDVQIKEDNTSYQQWDEPITVAGEFTTKGFIEQAGDILLFNAGGLIGSQSELYQEYERTTRVENEYNRGYLRKIVVDLPEGYTVQNAEDLNMDVSMKNKGKIVCLFKSTHTLEGSKLTILIDEYYDQVNFPLEQFEEFRSVINAAADWNKITLVLQPE